MSKVVVEIDGNETNVISIEEAKKKSESFSPLKNLQNTFYNETSKIIKDVKKPETYDGFDLEELICFLENVHEKYGNMKVLYFNGITNCFTKPSLNDIDIVKSYFTISSNTKTQHMNINSEKAISFFHC